MIWSHQEWKGSFFIIYENAKFQGLFIVYELEGKIRIDSWTTQNRLLKFISITVVIFCECQNSLSIPCFSILNDSLVMCNLHETRLINSKRKTFFLPVMTSSRLVCIKHWIISFLFYLQCWLNVKVVSKVS